MSDRSIRTSCEHGEQKLLDENYWDKTETLEYTPRALEVLKGALDHGARSITARMWAYRPVTTPLVVFDFMVSQHRDGPALFLGDYQGILLGDCWSGYDGIIASSNGKILQAACSAHARRKIFDSQAYPQERDQAGQTNYEKLLSWRWAKKHPDRVRHFRIRENERRANARRRHRQERRLVNDTS
ncbi:MAG: hypothetical protein KatS3mg110_3479 [Pirellulaceae bacterium]|nr:MAG: hypothetical protein KatS3mg110_3479 [Pirellulaceae bacterium]